MSLSRPDLSYQPFKIIQELQLLSMNLVLNMNQTNIRALQQSILSAKNLTTFIDSADLRNAIQNAESFLFSHLEINADAQSTQTPVVPNTPRGKPNSFSFFQNNPASESPKSLLDQFNQIQLDENKQNMKSSKQNK